MAAAQGIFQFVGRRGTYSVSAHFDDTANNPVRFSQSGAASATSATDWTPPEPVILMDVILGSATGKTQTQILRNSQPTGDMLLNAVHLATVVVRPALRVAFNQVSKIGAIQLT